MPAFVLTAALAYGLGRGVESSCSDPPEREIAAGVVTVSVGWFAVGLVSSLPLLLVAHTVVADPPALATPPMTPTLAAFVRPLDAVFEGVSGVTGTGFSMAADPSVLPRSLQWWRSLLQWVGGIGVVVLAAAFASNAENASFTEVHGSKAPTESIRSTSRGTAAALWTLLALFTVGGALLLWLAGMGPWAALNHSMTGVTTGGFTITENSIASYGDPAVELASIPLMIVGAVSFAVSFFLFRGDVERIRGDAQTRWLFGALGLGIALTTATLLASDAYGTPGESLRYGSYQLISGLTCTGFQTGTDLGTRWAATDQFVVTTTMLVGGAVGSTAGGVKLLRVRSVLLEGPVHGSAVYEAEGTSAETVSEASAEFDTAVVIAVLWFVSLFVTAFVALLVLPSGDSGYTVANVLFEVASVQGNVGLSAGIVGPDAPAPLKAAFVVSM